jgi:hypothetical protein
MNEEPTADNRQKPQGNSDSLAALQLTDEPSNSEQDSGNDESALGYSTCGGFLCFQSVYASVSVAKSNVTIKNQRESKRHSN